MQDVNASLNLPEPRSAGWCITMTKQGYRRDTLCTLFNSNAFSGIEQRALMYLLCKAQNVLLA